MAEIQSGARRVRMYIGSEEVLEFDATIRQEHSDENDVTEHPVEQGSDPADHIRKKPVTISMECVQSSTPLHIEAPATEFAQDGKTVKGGGWAPGINGRARGAYSSLLRAMNNGELVTLITSLRSYETLAITSLKVTRDSKSGDALAFSLSLKEVRLVSTKYEQPPTTDTRGKKKNELGKKVTTPPTEPQRTSALRATVDGSVKLVGGFFK